MTREQLLNLHERLCQHGRELMEKKNHDYTADGNPFSNFYMAETIGVPAKKGLLLRVLDKIKRLQTYIDKGSLMVEGEGYQDAAVDIVNYMVLLVGMCKDDERFAKERGDDAR